MKVILYSGGLDSYIGWWLLHRESEDWVPVYFDLNIRYSRKERALMLLPKEFSITDGVLNLRSIEDDDGYIPQRNVLLCTAAQALYGASEIALCSVADDVYADNTPTFHIAMSEILSLTAEYVVHVGSPLTSDGTMFPGALLLTKAEAVDRYLRLGGDPEMLRRTVSCYDAIEVSCGKCVACTRRATALRENGIEV